MNYELAKKLKDAGFPQSRPQMVDKDGWQYYVPTLEELIGACDKLVEDCVHISGNKNQWCAVDGRDGFGIYGGHGETPLEAVCNLWLELNKHDNI